MIGGRSALLSVAGGGNPYGNWTGNYSDVSLLLRGYGTLSLPKYGNSCLLAGTSPNYTWGANRIQVPAGPAFAYGTEDFTVEAWVYPTAFNNGTFWCQTVTFINYFLCSIDADGRPSFYGTLSGEGSPIFGPAILLNVWSHVAIVRKSGIVTVYSNGIGGTPASNTTDFSNTTYIPTIGSYTHSTSVLVFYGLIDDLRITKGVARYTSNFTPPTAELPASATDDPDYNSVSLLLRGNLTPELALADESSTPKMVTVFGSATSGSPVGLFSLKDDSPAQKTILSAGSVSISTTQSKYGGSALVAGTSPNFTWGANRIQIPAGTAFAYGTGDFTVEAWIYPTLFSGGLFWSQTVSGTNYFMCQIGTDGRPYFTFAESGGGTAVSGPVISLNEWSHVAIVRRAGQVTVYSNGVGGTALSCTQNFSNTTFIPTIGSYTHNASSLPFSGLIDDLRITKGVARYTKNFLPPPAELPAI